MLIMLILLAWVVLLALTAGLCAAARLGDSHAQRSSTPAPTPKAAASSVEHRRRTTRRPAATFTR
jgi:hypothetical protein